MASAAVLGSTGLVGSHILTTLLASEAFSTVTTISRRMPKPAPNPKLHTIVDSDTTAWAAYQSALSPAPHSIFASLASTRAASGTIAAQRKIDHDLNIELAKAAKASGVKTFVFISSTGAGTTLAKKFAYTEMKVGVEEAIRELDFEQAIVLRPGMILGDSERDVPRDDWLAAVFSATIGAVGRVSSGMADMLGQEGSVIARAAVAAERAAAEGRAPDKYWILECADIAKFEKSERKER